MFYEYYLSFNKSDLNFVESLVLFFFYTFVFMRLVIKQCLRAKFSSRHSHSPNVCENWQSPELSDIKPMSVLHLFEVPPYAIFVGLFVTGSHYAAQCVLELPVESRHTLN